MTRTEPDVRPEAALGVIDAIQGLEQSSLAAVRAFLDTLNSMFPDVRDDGARREVIEAAFAMVETIAATSSQGARTIILATPHARHGADV